MAICIHTKTLFCLHAQSTAIHEILEVNASIREMIFEKRSESEIKNQAIKNGMTPLREAGIDKIKEGTSTVEEILRATVEDN